MYEKQADVLKHKKHLLETQRVRHNCRKSTKYSYRAAVTHIHNTASPAPTPLTSVELNLGCSSVKHLRVPGINCTVTCALSAGGSFFIRTPPQSLTGFPLSCSRFVHRRTITLKVQKVPLFRFIDKLHTAAVLLPHVNIYVQQNTTYSSQGQTCLQRGNSHK